MSSRIERCYNIAELRKLAKKNMPAPMFHYIDGAADDERARHELVIVEGLSLIHI